MPADLAQQLPFIRRALEAFRRAGSPADIGAVLSNIAVCRTNLGEFAESLEAYEAARKHCEEHGLTLLVAESGMQNASAALADDRAPLTRLG